MTSKEEDWKPVVGFEGLYEVSSLGRVRSLDRRTGGPHGPNSRVIPGRYLKQPIDSVGYPHFGMTTRDGGHSIFRVHNVVAKAFIPNPTGLPLVRHLDDDKTNNHVDNLAWGTPAQNMQDKIRNGYKRERPSHCKRGHEISGRNEIVQKDGRRNCRECARSYQHFWNQGVTATENDYERFFQEKGYKYL